MEKVKKERERTRKAYSPDGTRGQKMFNFRLDLDLWEALKQQPNKGRYVNDAIRAYLTK